MQRPICDRIKGKGSVIHQAQGDEAKELPKFFISTLHSQQCREWHGDEPCRGNDVNVAIRQPELVVVDACSWRGAVPCFVYGCALEEGHEAAGGIVAGDHKRKDEIDYSRDADGRGDGIAEDIHVHNADGELCGTSLDLEKYLVEEKELEMSAGCYACWIKG